MDQYADDTILAPMTNTSFFLKWLYHLHTRQMNFKLGMYFIHLVFIISTKYKSVLGKTEKRLRLQSEALGTLYSRTNSVSDVSYSHFLLSPFKIFRLIWCPCAPFPMPPWLRSCFEALQRRFQDSQLELPTLVFLIQFNTRNLVKLVLKWLAFCLRRFDVYFCTQIITVREIRWDESVVQVRDPNAGRFTRSFVK